ncbi:hypothetical protein C0J52_27908 [Blattella germanica]|nr:hypothetical protein C0J52_27908 [Blattella germanica]
MEKDEVLDILYNDDSGDDLIPELDSNNDSESDNEAYRTDIIHTNVYDNQVISAVPRPFTKNSIVQTIKVPELKIKTIKGFTDVCALLLLVGNADVNAKHRIYKETTLHFAALNGHADVVELLLKCGADVHLKSSDGLTAFDKAVEQGHQQVARLLKHASNRDMFSSNMAVVGTMASPTQVRIGLFSAITSVVDNMYTL